LFTIGKFYNNNFIVFYKIKKIGDWGLGIGDWGLGIGGWGLGPVPNPQSPIPIYIIFFQIYRFYIF